MRAKTKKRLQAWMKLGVVVTTAAGFTGLSAHSLRVEQHRYHAAQPVNLIEPRQETPDEFVERQVAAAEKHDRRQQAHGVVYKNPTDEALALISVFCAGGCQ
jgi:hypothetical protein